MTLMIRSLAVFALLLCSAAAHAAVYKLDFSVNGFGPGVFSHFATPQAVVSGSFTFSAASLGAPITSLDAVDLTIAGHTYTLPEVSFSNNNNRFLFGAIANGTGVTLASTDDFYLILSDSFKVFVFSQKNVFDTWSSPSISTVYTPQVTAQVPEPSTVMLLAGALGALGMVRRRRPAAAPGISVAR